MTIIEKCYYLLGMQLFEIHPEEHVHVPSLNLLDTNLDKLFQGNYYNPDEIHLDSLTEYAYMNRYFLEGFYFARNKYLSQIPEDVKEIKLGNTIFKRN